MASVVLRGDRGPVEGIALRSAFSSARSAGKPVRMQFITPDAQNKVQGQLNLNAADAENANTINPGVFVYGDDVNGVRDMFRRVLPARGESLIQVIRLGQQGAYGIPVQVIAKINYTGDTSRLVLYRYDRGANTYVRIANPEFAIRDGYIFINTTVGGHIVVAQKA
jgi:hypothetical protein